MTKCPLTASIHTINVFHVSRLRGIADHTLETDILSCSCEGVGVEGCVCVYVAACAGRVADVAICGGVTGLCVVVVGPPSVGSCCDNCNVVNAAVCD